MSANSAVNNQKKKSLFSPFNAVILVLLTLYALVLIFFLYWVVVTSLKGNSDFKDNFFGFPEEWKFSNFITAFENFKLQVTRNGSIITVSLFPDIIVNTLLYTVGGAFFATVTPCFVSYVCAKYDYKFSKVLYSIVIITMILPIVGNLPAMLDVMNTLNIYDTFIGNWLQKANFLGMYFLIFFAAFKSLPNDYMEAAYIDGANEYSVMFKIMLPLVAPTFLTIMLIHFIDCWNDYMTPLLYLPSHPSIGYGVYKMSTSTVTGMGTAPMKMASCLIMVIPTVTVFVIFKDKLMGNLSMGGIKG